MEKIRGPAWAAIFLSFLLVSGIGNCQMANPGDPLQTSRILAEAERLLAKEPGDPQLHFIRGMALAELGRHLEAADEFRWMLVRDPNALRPRLELGRVLMLARQYGSARYNFEQVLAHELPPNVRRNVLNILAAIRERTPTLSISLEAISDSNPNQATSADEVEIRGLRYRINEDGRARKAQGARAAFEARIPLEESSLWFARANGEVQEYSESRLNFRYLQAVIGRNIPLSNQTLSFEIGGHSSSYGGRPLYDGGVVAATSYYQAGRDVWIKSSVAAQQLDYAHYRYLSGSQYSLFLQGLYTPTPTSRIEFGGGIVQNRAREAAYSFIQPSLNGRVAKEWVGGWITGVSFVVARSAYGDMDPIFQERRRDFDKRVEMDVSNRAIRLWKFTPRLQVGWVDRNSNLDFYSYSRTYVRIGITGDF